MEAIVILLLIGAIFCVFVLPILASIKAGNAARQARELASRVADLESRLASLAGQLRASQGRTLLPAGTGKGSDGCRRRFPAWT